MSSYWDDIIANAGNDSITEFSSKASSLVKLTNDEIKELIPEGVDQAKFAELMSVVDDTTKSNKEKADHIRNTVGFAEIAVNIVAKLL
ncbi:MAG: hypothetical protein MI976_08605 [Pseudomonadales bacterium]|nr:hypothetical protein [Pseudomonadales bacterium]